MRIALLTNSRLSVPAINYLAARGMLVSIGVPAGKRAAEDLDHVSYAAGQCKVPVKTFMRATLEPELSAWLDECRADVVLVFTFPFRIPDQLLNVPAHGFINFHFGVLPQYRGADAIFWQIKNREKAGGVSIHQMTPAIDEGPVYHVHKVPIVPSDTYASHLSNLAMAAIPALEKILPALQAGTLKGTPQDNSASSYYHRPALNDVVINWALPAASIIALINATNPWNKGAVSFLNQYPIKILSASAVSLPHAGQWAGKPGTIKMINEQYACCVCCGSGEILNLDILYCNDSFMTGAQFAKLGIQQGMQFENPTETKVA